MTIAMGYISPEGVILGADSTSSSIVGDGQGGYHYLNHNQKLFEIGEDGTAGVVTWGLGGLPSASHRTLLGLLADSIIVDRPVNLEGVAKRWAEKFFNAYNSEPAVLQCRLLNSKQPHDPNDKNNQAKRTADEEKVLSSLISHLFVGFFIGGYWPPSRTPEGFEIRFNPLETSMPSPKPHTVGSTIFGGAPNMINRLIFGADSNLKQKIMDSGKWGGTQQELEKLLQQFTLFQPPLPIRDAIDFVHSCIYSTIKALKFSRLHQICGGPIEIAVITSDRRFRWVKHKSWDSAIAEGGL